MSRQMRMQGQGQAQVKSIQKDIKRQFTKFIQDYFREYMKDPKNENFFLLNHAVQIASDQLYRFNFDLAATIFEQFYKYEKLLNQTFTQYMEQQQKNNPQYVPEQNARQQDKLKYFVCFTCGYGGNNDTKIDIRQLKSSQIGKLTTLFCTITRTTQVRPELVSGVFRCNHCGSLSKPVEQQFKYSQPKRCSNENCDVKSWQIMDNLSQYADFQQLRVQQDPNSIPPGGMPRSINVILRNYNTQKAQPGDVCKFVGYLCVVPQISSMLKPGQRTTLSTRNAETRGNMQMQGIKGIKGIRQLNYKFMFIANNIIVQNRQSASIQNQPDDDNKQQNQQDNKIDQNQLPKYNQDNIFKKMSHNYLGAQLQQLISMRDNPRLYDDMAQSLFPGIFGHTEIKKAILLQLLGGVHKVTAKNKISIRGDINVLLVGDPSTAKSQFLKTVNKFVPRSVYTNGKTTSAAGLTASVVRDDQGNVGIQAGALMLADNGVCCIDQFDKMNLSDMTAIHEAMQQQTISIAKAGVHATLNARTSVLAAANPLFGRYDKSKNLQKNINISPPIMSRFDLCFVICDQANIHSDSQLCNFIIKMHREKDTGNVIRYSTKSLKFYINAARKLKPMLTNQAALKLRKCYLNIRMAAKQTGSAFNATVRQLQSIIRLSEALAKLHLSLNVTAQYVQQAYRLILNSITRLKKPDVELIQQEQQQIKQNKNQTNVLDEQFKKKNQQKKDKLVTLSSDVYNQMISSILKLFLQEQKRRKGGMDEQIQILLTQQNIMNYVISLQLEKNTIQTEEQQKNYRKIIRAVLKKMIKDQRMLMVSEDAPQQNKRVLKIHPNFVNQ